MIPHSRPRFAQLFTDRLVQVIESGITAMGEEAVKLESKVARLLGRRGAVAVDSGTSAIMLSLKVLSEGNGGMRVGIPSYTCTSVFHAVRNAGCEPVLMDCNEGLCLNHQAIEMAESLDAVIVVHPFGMVEPLAATQWPCPVIEDIAQSAGAVLNGRPVGSFGDVTVASFYANKPWGGAYGGMVVADNDDVISRIRQMRDPDGSEVIRGYAAHHQLSDLHAAMATVRIDSSPAESESRWQIATEMDGWFQSRAQPVVGREDGNSYRYIIRTGGEAERWILMMHRFGVAAARPVKTPLHQLLGISMPGAERVWEDCVSIPLLADASRKELEIIHKAVTLCIA